MQPRIRTFLFAAAAVIASVAVACSDASTTPGSSAFKASSAISLGDTVTRILTDSVGPDTLVLDADRVLRLHVDLQETGSGQAGALSYSVIAAGATAALASGSSAASTSNLGPDVADASLSWFRLPKAGKYFVVITRARTSYRGGYRVRVVGSDPAPEHIPAVLAFGDSGVERVDRPGDVDEFILVGHAGATAPILFLKAETGQAGDTLIVESATDAVQLRPIAVAATSDANAFGVASAITPPASDTVRIRVRAAKGTTVGQYRIKWISVNEAPEGVSPDIAAGDTVAAAIDFPGDVDVFTFQPDSTKRYALAAQETGTRSSDHLRFEVRGVAGDSLRLSVTGGVLSALGNQMTPNFQSKKPITIRVTNDGPLLGPAPYRIAIVEVNTGPENAPDLLTYGDTISDDIPFQADVDEFDVDAQPGDTVIVFAQAISPDTSLRLGVETTGFTGAPFIGLPFASRLSFAVTPGAPLRATSSFAMVAVDTGPYKITIRGMGSNAAAGQFSFVGAYRLVVSKVSGAPETAPRAVAGNVVVTEDGFPSGELDRFVFDGTAGQEIAVYTSVFPKVEEGASASFTLRSGSTNVPGSSSDSLGWFGTGLRTLTGGPVFIDVQPASKLGDPLSYRLWVYVVDRHPEGVPSTIHLGDVVNEAIYPSADIDEYTLAAAPGARFQGCLLNRTQFVPNEGMGLLIEGAGTTTASVSSASGDGAPRCSPTQTIPSSGTMTLRVLTSQSHGGPYELRVVAVP